MREPLRILLHVPSDLDFQVFDSVMRDTTLKDCGRPSSSRLMVGYPNLVWDQKAQRYSAMRYSRGSAGMVSPMLARAKGLPNQCGSNPSP